ALENTTKVRQEPRKTSQVSLVPRRRRVPQLLSHELGRIGARSRAEFLHPAAKHFGEVQVALLVDGDRMWTVELTRKPARPAPAVQVLSVKIVFDDSVRSPVSSPKRLVRRNEMGVRRRPNAGFPHVEELTVLVEN